jgi:hypothetical protein
MIPFDETTQIEHQEGHAHIKESPPQRLGGGVRPDLVHQPVTSLDPETEAVFGIDLQEVHF